MSLENILRYVESEDATSTLYPGFAIARCVLREAGTRPTGWVNQ
jgi:hypothetical protein